MNEPDLEIWKQLRKKWADLDASGHHININIKLITDPKDKNKVLTIDVVQKIDEETVIETVQHIAKEAYGPLGIANASIQYLKEIYKKKMYELFHEAEQLDASLIVSMSPTSPTSGEVRAVLEKMNTENKKSIEVDYSHYYILNALREKMMETQGIECGQVKAVYKNDELEFHFEY
jgi:hypothetical protein